MSFVVHGYIPRLIPLNLLPPILSKTVPPPLSKKENEMMNKL